jgi:hypothetical protein
VGSTFDTGRKYVVNSKMWIFVVSIACPNACSNECAPRSATLPAAKSLSYSSTWAVMSRDVVTLLVYFEASKDFHGNRVHSSSTLFSIASLVICEARCRRQKL